MTSGPKGYEWGYATATTKYKGKVLVLAFHQYTKGMKKDEVVRSLVEQVRSMRLKIRLLALYAEFYTVEVLRLISQFNYIIAVPAGDVRIYSEFDGYYTTRSKRISRDKQVTFRLIVHGRTESDGRVQYFARATNLGLPAQDVLGLYNDVRNPIETSYRNIKSFLMFTSSPEPSGSWRSCLRS